MAGPHEFPNLDGVDLAALDCETRDPDLKALGPGYCRAGDPAVGRAAGYVVGYSLAWRRGDAVHSAYLPVAHEAGENLDVGQVCSFLSDFASGRMLGNAEKVACKLGTPALVMANAPYDMGWARRSGVSLPGLIYDVQIAEPLINENRPTYKLDALAHQYLGEGKLGDELAAIASARFGIPQADAMAHLWRLSGEEVGPYARTDAELTLRVWEKQREVLASMGLIDLFLLETDLLKVLVEMTYTGVRVDVDGARQLQGKFEDELAQNVAALAGKVGREVGIWVPDDLAALASAMGHTERLLYTKTGAPSFTSGWLERQPEPEWTAVLRARKLDKALSMTIRAIIERQVSGRIHPQYHQVRTERGGAATGRLSTSGPNMQQVPSRDEDIAPAVRALILPEPGHLIVSADWANIEPRVGVHYAHKMGLRGAAEIVAEWNKNPRTNYHKWVAGFTGLDYKFAKPMNLGLTYGMGLAKMADTLGLTIDECRPLWDTYHDKLPYVKQFARKASDTAETRGFIKTLLGRRRNFDLYGPRQYKEGMRPKLYDEAVKEFGPHVVRWFTYRAGNAVIQGTAADLFKKAAVDLANKKLIARLPVHDEFVFSVPKSELRDTVPIIRAVMETCVQLVVPTPVDIEVGPNWGNLKGVD